MGMYMWLTKSGRLSSTNVTSRFASQPSAKAGAPKLGVAGHSMV